MTKTAPNATKHGLLSELLVLDAYETQEAWLAHRQSFWEDLKPQGAAQEAIVEQIALTLWRKARLARAEVSAAALHQARQVEAVAFVLDPQSERRRPLAEARHELQVHEDACAWLAAYHQYADDAELPPGVWDFLMLRLLAIFHAARPDTGDPHAPDAFGEPRQRTRALIAGLDLSTFDITSGTLRQVVDAVARLSARSAEQVLALLTTAVQQATRDLAPAVRAAEARVEQVRAATQLPAEAELALYTRYDAHLGRELARLFRTLRDLRMPAPSLGRQEPPPVTGPTSSLPPPSTDARSARPAPDPRPVSVPVSTATHPPAPRSPLLRTRAIESGWKHCPLAQRPSAAWPSSSPR